MKKIYAIVVALLVFTLFIIPDVNATITLKINNKIQSELTIETACVGSVLTFNTTVINNPPALAIIYPNPRWTGTGAVYLDDKTTNNVTFTCPAIPGDYDITFSAIKAGITYSITQSIRVINRDPMVLNSPTLPLSICEGSSVSLQASGTDEYYWERDGGSGFVNIGNIASFNDTPPSFGSFTYRVWGWRGGCPAEPDSIEFQVTVNQAPIANTGGPYTTCYGTPIVLNGSIGGSASSAQWIGGAGTFSPNRNTLNATYTPALSESGTSVSLTLKTDDPIGVCTFVEAITTLTVNPLPAAITGTANVCVGLTTTLANATAGGSWSSATPAVAIIDASGVVTAVSAGTSVISYTLPTGCFVTRTVTVNPLPSAITGTTNVCVNSTTLLSNATPGGSWSSATPAVATISVGGLVTGISAGTSVISYTLPTGCKEVVTVTVNPLPAAITGTLVVCAGSTTNLANATPGGTWSSATPAVATIDASGVVTGVSGGTSVISYTLPTGCSSTATVTVNPLPAAITGTTTVCVTMTTTLSNVTLGGTWSSATPAVATIDAGGVVTGVSAGTSVISYTLPTGCSRSVTVTVNSMPSPITGTTNVCLGGTTTLANATPGGTWSSATPAVATIDAAGVVTSVSAGTSVISYTLGSGCSTSVTVTVNPLPAAITGTTAVCAGSTTQLNNATPGGTWSSATTTVATINATGLVTGVASGNSIISYTLPTGCKTTATVTVNPLPVAITGTASVCIGSTTTFACTTPGGTWSSATPAVATIDASGVITAISAGTSVISYTLPTGCARTRTVTVVALPTITLAAVSPVCQDATSFSLPYTARTGTPTTYSISAGVPALVGFVPVVNAPFGASPFIVPIPGGSTAGTYQFVITVRNATGCVSTPNNFSVTINPLPAAITGTTTVCVGLTTNLSNTTPGGTWSSGTPAVATINAGGVVTGVSAGTSVISYTLGSGCKVTTTVTVNPLPAAITGTTNVCIGATTSLANTSPGGTWSSGTPAVATIDASGVVTGISSGSSVITYTLPTTCSVSTTVTVNALPTITLGTVNAVCKVANSFSLPYTATTGTPTSYSISSGVPALAGFVPVINAAFGASPLSITIPANSTPGTYQFSITVRNGNGCVSTSQNFNLTINDLPTVTFGGVLATQCITSTTYLLTGGLPVGGTYSGTGVTGTNFNASVAGAGTHTITYTYNDINGCSGSATNTITVNPAIGNNTISSATTSICYNTIPVAFTGTTPTGGSGAYTYQWESSTAGAGGPFAAIAGELSKDYTPTNPITVNTWYRRVVTSAPCSASNSNVIQITVGPVFTVSITPKSPKCVGTATGEATANPVGGTPAPGGIYSYSWDTSPIQTNQTATSLSAGILYTVTVTDNIGCTATSTVTLTDPTPVTLGLPTVVDVTGCFGGNNGSISIQASGGSGPYKYDLYNNGVFVATQTVAGAVIFTQPTTPITASTQYEVRVTDANGCGPISSGLIEVKQPAQLVIDNVIPTPITCNGTADGVIVINASGGTGPYTYSVTGPLPGGTFQPGNTFNVGKGTYNIVVMDANSCTAIWPTAIVLKDPPKISFNYLVTQITTCSYDNTGKIEILNASGGSGTGYEYSITQPPTWGTNPIFNNLSGGAANPYYVRVRDSRGCIVTANSGNPIIIDAPDPITFDIVNQVNVTGCWYSTNGSFRVQNALGGTGNLSVSINGTDWYALPKDFNSLGIGNINVTVRDDNNCETVKVVSITGPTPITLDAPPTIVGLSCNSVIPADGSISLSASGGAVGALSYSIDGGAPQAVGNFVGVSGGNHTITITDVLGCHLDVPVNVPEPPAITFTTEQKTDITCFGVPANGTITLLASGGTGALTYTLNPGAVNLTPGVGLPAIYPNLAAGSYTYLVTDSKGCFIPSSVPLVIIEPADILVTTNPQVDINCSGGTGLFSVDASGGTGTLVYNLYDNTHTLVATTNDGEFPISVGGTYTVEVTDANSCGPKIAGPLTFTSPTPIIISTPVITQMTAPAANDGKIKLNATGGTGLLTFTLNPGGAVLTAASGVDVEFTNLAAGIYTIDVTDANTCSASIGGLRIGLLDLTLTPTHITCNGLNDGKIALTINSGTGPYTISWTGPGGPLPAFNDILTITGLSAGLYSVNVTDALGVTGIASVTIIEPAVFDASVLTINDKLCFGNANGSVTFNIVGGSAPYTITWTEGSTPRTEIVNAPPYNATNVLPGTYSFTVASAGTCGSKTIPNVTLTDPAQLNITGIDWKNPCFGQTNGSVIVTASGGTGVLTYSLTGQPDNNNGIFNNLPIGNYTVSLTDANSCTATTTLPLTGTLTENPDINIAVVPPAFLLCSYDLGTIDITVTGGTPGYTYSWNSVPVSTDEDLTASKGNYTVIVTDAIGCTKTKANNIIDGPSDIAITAPTVISAKCSSWLEGSVDVGSITLGTVSGGTGPYSITWSYPVGSTTLGNVLNGLSGGRYDYSIEDANGCIYIDSVRVPSDPNYVIDAFILKDTTLCGSASFDLEALPQNDDPVVGRTYTYKWNNVPLFATPLQSGANPIFSINPMSTTRYYVQIKNDGDCVDTASAKITIYPKINLSVPPYISALRRGDNILVKDTIISILQGNTYNLDVIAESNLYPTKFKWEPNFLFEPDTSWNSSIYIDKEILAQIPQNRMVTLKDPDTKRQTPFILVDIKAVTNKGCKDSLRLYTKIVDNIAFGNVFSPNDDGINDVWLVPKDYLFPDLSIEIFNRWGARVWSASGDKAARGWNGKTDNGKELPIGTYYYVVKFNVNTSDGNWKPLTGSVTIIR